MTIDTIHAGQLATPALAAGGLPADLASIVQFANTAEAARRLTEAVVDTPFFPAAFWPKFDPRDRDAAGRAREVAIASGTAAVLYGAPLGLNPLQSWASIHVVKGKPGLYAETMVALVNAAGHEVGVEDLTDLRCRVWGKRAGSEHVYRAEFLMERAKKAGYVAQNAKYNQDPQSMLYARAVSILCRQMAPEVLKGLSTAEELQDEPDADATAPRTRTVQRAVKAAPAPALAAPAPAGGSLQAAVAEAAEQRRAAPAPAPAAGLPPLPGEDEPAPAVPMVDERQWRAVNARFSEVGVSGDGQSFARLQVIRRIVGRPALGKGSELTAAEAQLVLDNLAGDAGVRLVRRVLTEDNAPAHLILADPDAAPAETQVEVDGTDAALPDEVAEHDPTLDQDWPMDGAEASSEGHQ